MAGPGALTPPPPVSPAGWVRSSARTFSIDVKPEHGSPDFARDVAFQKITARVEGAAMASEALGV